MEPLYRVAVFVVLLLCIVISTVYSTVFEETYSNKLINLYTYPWWRLLLVLLVIVSATWSHQVSIIVALIVVFYLSDMKILSTKII